MVPQVRGHLLAANLGLSIGLPNLNHHHLDRFRSSVHVGMALHPFRSWKPVRLAGLPVVRLRRAIFIDDLHGSTCQRDDDARMLMSVHRQRSVGWHYRLPDHNVFILKLRSTLCRDRRCGRLRRHRTLGCKNQGPKQCDAKQSSRHGRRYYHAV